MFYGEIRRLSNFRLDTRLHYSFCISFEKSLVLRLDLTKMVVSYLNIIIATISHRDLFVHSQVLRFINRYILAAKLYKNNYLRNNSLLGIVDNDISTDTLHERVCQSRHK